MKRPNLLLFLPVILSVISLFLEQADPKIAFIRTFINLLDFVILGILILEVLLGYLRAKIKQRYLKQNLFPLSFLVLFMVLFFYNKLFLSFSVETGLYDYSLSVVIIRNVFILLKIFSRMRRLNEFLVRITTHPAQTILVSFLLVILTGTVLLMMPFTTLDGAGLDFIDSLFTATSAVCVTGLIVVDTATVFTLTGKIIILLLIQIGGLGIMIISFFIIFTLRRSVSIEDKLLISYMLSESDMSNLVKTLRRIIYITFICESIGAVLLFLFFIGRLKSIADAVLFSIFHAVSAFCNAGFALFTNSLENFSNNFFLNIVICGLIIVGGISFSVLINMIETGTDHLSNLFNRNKKKRNVKKIALNTRVVLIATLFLLVLGTLLIYAFEHNNTLKHLPTGHQYLASFFQSVTLRTAGFNTIPIGSLATVSFMFMLLFMFIGAAAGSTAGGIKINTISVILAYVVSFLRSSKNVTLLRHSVPPDKVLKAFLIFLFGVSACFLGVIVLSLVEDAPLKFILFEVFSAFGTVGLSAGITSSLSGIGKSSIILLMYMGRLGPLTILAAATMSTSGIRIEYPEGDIAIG